MIFRLTPRILIRLFLGGLALVCVSLSGWAETAVSGAITAGTIGSEVANPYVLSGEMAFSKGADGEGGTAYAFG